LRWPAADDHVSAEPESGDVPLTIRVSYEGGAATYVRGAETEVLGCPDRVDIEVSVEIETEGGALNERFETVLAMESRIGRIHYRRPRELLGGSLSITPSQDSNATVLGPDLDFALQVSELGTSGRLAVTADGMDTTAGAVVPLIRVAGWPAGADCPSNELVAPPDGSVSGVSPMLISDLVAAQRVPFTWADGTTTDLIVSPQPSDRAGCALEDGDVFHWRFDADVSAATSDGALNGPLSASVHLIQQPERVTAVVEMSGTLGNEPLRALLPISDAAATNPYDGYVDFAVRHSFAWPSEQFLGSQGRLSVVVAPPPACDEEECDVRFTLAEGGIPREVAPPQ
jgi:hypothetical protein